MFITACREQQNRYMYSSQHVTVTAAIGWLQITEYVSTVTV